MDASQCCVGIAFTQIAHLDTVLTAHHQTLAVLLLIDKSTHSIEVSCQHHGKFFKLTRFVTFVHLLQMIFDAAFHTQIVGIVHRAQERQSIAHHSCLRLVARRKGENVAFKIEGFSLSLHSAAHIDVVQTQQFFSSFDACTRVVVACYHYHLHSFIFLRALVEKIKKQALHLHTGVRRIEDIATDDEGIGLFVLQRLEQPLEEMAMLSHTTVLMKDVAQMKVCGMDDFHCNLCA